MWKVINLADLPGWVKKSPRVRGGFFSVLDVGGLWDGFTGRACAVLFIVLY